jgi:predicted TIM-barrel fold metal-dependent hydrolase
MPMIDVHCHVFNKDVLTTSGKVLAMLGDLVTDLINSGDYDHAETTIERVNAFVEMSRKDTSDIAKILLDKYGSDSVIVPLMYDMYYLTHNMKNDFEERLNSIFKTFDKITEKDDERAAAIKSKIMKIGTNIQKDHGKKIINRDSFNIQIRELTLLKNKYKDRVYPFVSYDPRRSGNLEIIKSTVGPGKLFHGVKLYAPLGFSAADGRMMDKQNGFYAYCVANDIPITAHCSCPGMPTLNRRLNVPHDSWVFVSDTGKPDDEDGACSKHNHGKVSFIKMDKDVTFPINGKNLKSLYFNHPDIWKIVLDEYPGLRLNLAHFGGDCNDWRNRIAQMINSNKYQNLYTDLSCRTNVDEIQGIRNEYDKQAAIQRRLMYGSDFSIVLMSSDLTNFLKNIESAFPVAKHQDIYCDNAKRFLKLL